MKTAPEKKFLIVAPIISDRNWYWMCAGRGNTDDINQARRFPEKEALDLVEKEPLLKMIPA